MFVSEVVLLNIYKSENIQKYAVTVVETLDSYAVPSYFVLLIANALNVER